MPEDATEAAGAMNITTTVSGTGNSTTNNKEEGKSSFIEKFQISPELAKTSSDIAPNESSGNAPPKKEITSLNLAVPEQQKASNNH